MNRLFLAAVVGLLAVTVSRADLIPPGTRNIAVDHKIETDTELPDWVFFVARGSGGVQQVKLDPKNPVVIAGSAAIGNGPVPQPGAKPKPLALGYRTSTLIAVPKDAVKEYKTDKELLAAVEETTVKGMVRVKGSFFDHANAKVTDARKSITLRYRITKIDAKDGIVLDEIKEAPGKEEEEETAASRTAFPWIATGLALAAGIGFAGLWVTRRTRRV